MDGPEEITGLKRKLVNVKRIVLTKFVIKIGVGARAKSIKKALAKDNIIEKYEQSGLYKKHNIQKVRSETTDFDRFKIMIAKKIRARAVNNHLAKLKASA